MTTRWARVARGTLAASFAVFVAALFHAAMGGGVPSTLAITVSLAFAVQACVLLAGKRISLWRQVLSVGLSQFILHALFSLQPGGARFSAADGSAHVHAGSHLTMTGGSAAAHGAAMVGMQDTPLMWVGHAGAAVLTVVAMRYGERTMRRLLATAAIRIVAFVERVTLIPVRATVAIRRTVDVRPVMLPEPRVLIGGMRHRGPPASPWGHALSGVSACA